MIEYALSHKRTKTHLTQISKVRHERVNLTNKRLYLSLRKIPNFQLKGGGMYLIFTHKITQSHKSLSTKLSFKSKVLLIRQHTTLVKIIDSNVPKKNH